MSKKSKDDSKFYREVWENSNKCCEECALLTEVNDPYLGEDYNPSYISHIISRGADTRMRHDKRNINILCHYHHTKWEFGDRAKMKINKLNELKVKELKYEYNNRHIWKQG